MSGRIKEKLKQVFAILELIILTFLALVGFIILAIAEASLILLPSALLIWLIVSTIQMLKH